MEREKKAGDQVAIVTGAARGIGLAIARRLSADGFQVAIWDQDVKAFDYTNAGFEPLMLQTVDVSSLRSVQQAYNDLALRAGEVDVVVNNAGINGPTVPVWEYDAEDWQRVLDVDLNSVFYVCQTVLPHMRTRGYGRIVNVASISGKEGNANNSAYAAAKAGVIAFTKSIAKEVADSGILVNCVAPAITETDLLRQMAPEFISTIKAKIPMGRFLRVDEIAGMVSFIAGPDCSFTTGFVFDLSGGRATY
jgi:3-oxoacyl-[acyl-carrier protein] reductase